MSKIAIFLTSEGGDARPELEHGLKAGGFRIDRSLTYDEARDHFEGLGEQEGVFIFSAFRGNSQAAPGPVSVDLPVKTLLIEMLMHQLTNIVKDQESLTSTLVDMLRTGAWLTDERFRRQILTMHEVSQQHVDILNLMSNVTTDDSRGPCLLREAVDRTCKLLSSALAHREIEVDVDVDVDIHLGIPIQALVMVLCNLVGNAKEAIVRARESDRRAGRITIVADNREPRHILCRVIDDGVGVPEELRERIFEEGVTTKELKGERSGGQGLPLSVRALGSSGANIELTDSKPGETVFTIRFPKLSKEAK